MVREFQRVDQGEVVQEGKRKGKTVVLSPTSPEKPAGVSTNCPGHAMTLGGGFRRKRRRLKGVKPEPAR